MLSDVVSHGDTNSLNTHINILNEPDAAVTVNSHDFEIYKHYIKDVKKLHLIQDAVDTDRFTPEGYAHPDGSPVTEGYISLQAESHPVEFRNIELLDLKNK